MSGAHSISTRRAYGVQRVCRVWARPRSSVSARRQTPRDCTLGPRRGPVGAAPDEVLVVHIRRVLEASPFHREGYRKVWAKLRVEGIRTAKERVRRVMREHKIQAPHRVGQAHGPKAHDGTTTTETPDVMWGTDMTGCVATFQERQERDWSSWPGSVSCHHLEQVVDELNLSPHIRTAHPPRLPLLDHVHGLVALDRSPRRAECTKALLGLHASFDRSMILLQDVVQVLDRPVAATTSQESFLFHP